MWTEWIQIRDTYVWNPHGVAGALIAECGGATEAEISFRPMKVQQWHLDKMSVMSISCSIIPRPFGEREHMLCNHKLDKHKKIATQFSHTNQKNKVKTKQRGRADKFSSKTLPLHGS